MSAKNNTEYLRAYSIKYPARIMLQDARKRAKKKGLEFDITEEDIKIPKFCPVLGILLEKGTRRWQDASPSLDRVNNSLGYIKNNICVISKRANALKRDGTVEEFRAVIKYMEDHVQPDKD